ncbi:MAG: PH domain-containing protein [Planctomycetales bacterium]|nr:PH domain-containing protein [Planctomycetales bacterium]
MVDSTATSAPPSPTFRPEETTRPNRVLLTYYGICSALLGPFFPLAFIPLYCKYATLRYEFDDEGISVRWGVLFRREVYLTYRRIQDIHLTRNILQRWIGLASISVQTASGNSTPETTIEGVLEAEALRDFLYARMRGSRDGDGEANEASSGNQANDDALALLTDIRDALAQLVDRSSKDA